MWCGNDSLPPHQHCLWLMVSHVCRPWGSQAAGQQLTVGQWPSLWSCLNKVLGVGTQACLPPVACHGYQRLLFGNWIWEAAHPWKLLYRDAVLKPQEVWQWWPEVLLGPQGGHKVQVTLTTSGMPRLGRFVPYLVTKEDIIFVFPFFEGGSPKNRKKPTPHIDQPAIIETYRHGLYTPRSQGDFFGLHWWLPTFSKELTPIFKMKWGEQCPYWQGVHLAVFAMVDVALMPPWHIGEEMADPWPHLDLMTPGLNCHWLLLYRSTSTGAKCPWRWPPSGKKHTTKITVGK